MRNWQEAVELYRNATKMSMTGRPSIEIESETPGLSDILRAALSLEIFMNSEEGRVALTLLEASTYTIYFGIEFSRSDETTLAFYIDGTGLRKYVRITKRTNSGSLFGSDLKINPCGPMEIILAATHPAIGGKDPQHVMAWLRSQLDAIASKAPRNISV